MEVQFRWHYANNLRIKFPPLRFFSGSYSEPPLTEETLHGGFTIQKVQRCSRALQGAEALYSPEFSSANTETGEMYGTHESGKLSHVPYSHNARFQTIHHTSVIITFSNLISSIFLSTVKYTPTNYCSVSVFAPMDNTVLHHYCNWCKCKGW